MATTTTIGRYHIATNNYANLEQNLGRRTVVDTIGALQPHLRHLLHVMATTCRIYRRDIPLHTAHMSESVSASGEYG